jgi:hypothetical protein
MPFDWQIFMRILMTLLRILQNLPPEADHTPVAALMADAIEANGITPSPGGQHCG